MATPPKIAPQPLLPPPVYRPAATAQEKIPVPLAGRMQQQTPATPGLPLQQKTALVAGVRRSTLPPPVYRPEARQPGPVPKSNPAEKRSLLQLKNAGSQPNHRLIQARKSVHSGPLASRAIQRSAAAADWRNDPEQGAGSAWPLSSADRPYNDFPEGKYPGAVGRRYDFSGDQKNALKAYNRHKNGGTLKSDAKDDPHQDLTDDVGNDSSVEVDHIIPKVRGGCNHFLNARLISREQNNSVERIKDISKMVAAKVGSA